MCEGLSRNCDDSTEPVLRRSGLDVRAPGDSVDVDRDLGGKGGCVVSETVLVFKGRLARAGGGLIAIKVDDGETSSTMVVVGRAGVWGGRSSKLARDPMEPRLNAASEKKLVVLL